MLTMGAWEILGLVIAAMIGGCLTAAAIRILVMEENELKKKKGGL